MNFNIDSNGKIIIIIIKPTKKKYDIKFKKVINYGESLTFILNWEEYIFI